MILLTRLYELRGMFKDILKGYSRLRILSIATCILVIICFLGANLTGDVKIDDSDSTSDKLSMKVGGVYAWCEAFLNGDFSECDNNTSIDDIKLSSFYSSEEVYSSTLSSELYEVLLEISSSSILKIEECSSEDETFELEVYFKPFKEITDFHFDCDSYRTLCDSYISGDLSQSDFDKAVAELIIDGFRNCFVLEDTECSFKCSLIEENLGERSIVTNASDLYLPLLEQQGVLPILEVFERDFKEQFNKYSEEYLT